MVRQNLINLEKSATEYLSKLNIKIKKVVKQATIVSKVNQNAYAKYDNRKAIYKEFKPGDQVHLLIPNSTNKLYAR